MVRKFLLVFLPLIFGAALLAAPTAVGSEPDLEATYRQFIAAIDRGDVNAALILMTDDAQLQGTPGCLANPCRGKQAVRADLEQDAAAHLYIQLLGTPFVSGNTVKSNTAHRADILRGTGISRIIINETVTFQGDKISRVVFDPQVSDPQTARLVQLLTAGPAPAQPAGHIPSVRPPATGDGGLLSLTAGTSRPGSD